MKNKGGGTEIEAGGAIFWRLYFCICDSNILRCEGPGRV